MEDKTSHSCATLVARATEGAKCETEAKIIILSAQPKAPRLCLFEFALYDGTGHFASSISPILANPLWVLHFSAIASLNFTINLGSWGFMRLVHRLTLCGPLPQCPEKFFSHCQYICQHMPLGKVRFCLCTGHNNYIEGSPIMSTRKGHVVFGRETSQEKAILEVNLAAARLVRPSVTFMISEPCTCCHPTGRVEAPKTLFSKTEQEICRQLATMEQKPDPESPKSWPKFILRVARGFTRDAFEVK